MLPLLGNIYIADCINNRIRKVTVSTGIITTIAGSGGSGNYGGNNGDGGAATSASIYAPYGVSLDSSGSDNLYLYLIYYLFLFPCPLTR